MVKVYVALAQLDEYETVPFVIGVFVSKEYGEAYIKRRAGELSEIPWEARDNTEPMIGILPKHWNHTKKMYVGTPHAFIESKQIGHLRIGPLGVEDRHYNNFYEIWFEEWEVQGND